MILVPAGVKVHIALGVTDLRKGLDGLAMLVQGGWNRIPSRGICSLFAAAGPISSKSCSGTGRVFASSPSGWRKGASPGPERTRLATRWL